MRVSPLLVPATVMAFGFTAVNTLQAGLGRSHRGALMRAPAASPATRHPLRGTEGRLFGHWPTVRTAFLLVPALIAGCGARTPLDLPSGAFAPSDAATHGASGEAGEVGPVVPPEAACSFELTGSIMASFVGVSATACLCDSDSQLIELACTGTLAGKTYSYVGVYFPSAGLPPTTQVEVAGSTFYDIGAPCTGTVLLNGQAAPAAFDDYHVGDLITVDFACLALAIVPSEEAGTGTVELRRGRLSTRISAKL